MQSREIRNASLMLAGVKDPIASFQARGHLEPHDILFLYDDEFFIVEMEDNSFWATTNSTNPDDDRTREEHMQDTLARASVVDGVLTLEGEDPKHYYGAYFTNIDYAVKAVHEWKITGKLPKEYRPPIDRR